MQAESVKTFCRSSCILCVCTVSVNRYASFSKKRCNTCSRGNRDTQSWMEITLHQSAAEQKLVLNPIKNVSNAAGAWYFSCFPTLDSPPYPIPRLLRLLTAIRTEVCLAARAILNIHTLATRSSTFLGSGFSWNTHLHLSDQALRAAVITVRIPCQ